jgi:hypothetical protein
LLAGELGEWSNVVVSRDKRIDDERVVHDAASLSQNRKSLRRGEAGPVRTIRSQRIETVDYREDARTDGDVGSSYAAWVPAAAVSLPGLFRMCSGMPSFPMS